MQDFRGQNLQVRSFVVNLCLPINIKAILNLIKIDFKELGKYNLIYLYDIGLGRILFRFNILFYYFSYIL